MAGHSQFKNIMYRKGAQDAKRARLFTKIVREITIAAKDNLDPNFNPRLRNALEQARQVNMPKDNIKKAMDKAEDKNSADLAEITYQGYGPYGVAVILETITDNRNRTVSEIRSLFNKFNSNFGQNVDFLFDYIGTIVFNEIDVDYDKVFDACIDFAVEDVKQEEGKTLVICQPVEVHKIASALSKVLGEPELIGRFWQPKLFKEIDQQEIKESLANFFHLLEEIDDVQDVFTDYKE